MNNNETRLEELAKAIEEGNQDLALELARSLLSGDLEFDETILVATGFLEGGSPSDGLELLQALESAEPPSEISEAQEAELQELLRVRLAEALYATGDPEKALETLQPVASRGVEEAADREYFTALCCDHLGDRALADAHLAMATELDPERNPPIPTISIEDAQNIVGQVIGELPDALRDAVQKVPILIEDLPSISWIRETGGEIHPDTLGLYTGVNLMIAPTWASTASKKYLQKHRFTSSAETWNEFLMIRSSYDLKSGSPCSTNWVTTSASTRKTLIDSD